MDITLHGMDVQLIRGDIQSEEVDVIVNTTGSVANLYVGDVSSSLAQYAGPHLQEEYRRKRNNKPYASGEVICTDGYDLQCKQVFHGFCKHWDDGAVLSEQILRKYIFNCLELAHEREFSSISFPAIGTGNLKIPRAVVAKAMFEEIDKFGKKKSLEKTKSNTRLNDIRIILYEKDPHTVKAFEDHVEKLRHKRNLRRSVNSTCSDPMEVLYDIISMYIGKDIKFLARMIAVDLDEIDAQIDNLDFSVADPSLAAKQILEFCWKHATDEIIFKKRTHMALIELGRKDIADKLCETGYTYTDTCDDTKEDCIYTQGEVEGVRAILGKMTIMVALKLGNNWRDVDGLFCSMRVDGPNVYNQLKSDCSNDLRERNYQLLRKWRHSEGHDAHPDTLVENLRPRHQLIIDELVQKFGHLPFVASRIFEWDSRYRDDIA